MSNITVNGYNIAEVSREQSWLKFTLGHYELGLNFTINGSGTLDGKEYRAALNSARIGVNIDNATIGELGLASLETPLILKAVPTISINEHFTFYLPLSSHQISEIEKARDGKDIEFSLTINGTGSNGEQQNTIHDRWTVKISKSDWVEKLNNSGYMKYLLLEVAMPSDDNEGVWKGVKEKLNEAHQLFTSGQYLHCVSLCRGIVQEAGEIKCSKKSWSDSLLDRIGKKAQRGVDGEKHRKNMTKDEREMAIWATLRHYTHQSHHTESEGGVDSYTRADAKLVLSLTAAFVGM